MAEVKEDNVRERMSKIKHKILVMSGKGGVGKTTVSVNMAYLLASKGNKVGLLDVDLHGPNVVKMLGLEDKELVTNNTEIMPVEAEYGLKVISMASLLKNPDEPVIWRGPLKMGAIKQFLSDVNWGDLDYLIIDSPPGTGDEPLSICQLIENIDGVVIVTTPQDVAIMDSKRAVGFAQKLNIPIIGIIENMSGFTCPHCKKNINIFKKGGAKKTAEYLEVRFLGSISFSPKMVELSDEGIPFTSISEKDSVTNGEFVKIVEKIKDSVEK
ncbi:Mrp/NBP35 family ATP-binding protein [bacterium]|nr:Mrp/NBP35 family ATP-binding protein [bacterium]